jgi:uncharacterized protein YbjT (DUF2867 family)
MILVVGSTGLVGTDVCRRLKARGEGVRALVRTTSSKEKTERLRSEGIELTTGDLKDADSLASACRGVDAVISTATSTITRQPGDSIESVDEAGQLNLVKACKDANVRRFVLVSFRSPRIPFPLSDAKKQVENAVRDLNFTVLQPSLFMEVWLSPALGFDYTNASARIFGPGTSRISWVSYQDVAEMCAIAIRHPGADRRIIEFGGPEALSPLEVVSRFEEIGRRKFRLEHVPEETLRSEFDSATDSMQKSFAGLMLGYVHGDVIDMGSMVEEFGIRKLTTVDEYARSVLRK